ncbi:hypothetical protein [Aegicerativicinus sediminis]|uniref:hypothetical protein n=1 Tax=Aegicerativicinus sediminis TaxID=2893202 RepID=UPI001E5C8084|nr:hypothetical protein [Aegicerativicinus sediminis]
MSQLYRDKSTWAIGGGLLLGLGIGFVFLQTSALYFVGSIIAGLGLGLLITAIISGKKTINF